jgi:group II intron reverse transcriptase/maturase
MRKACRKVWSNKGSAGIDGMPAQELTGYLDIKKETLLFAIEGTSQKDETTMNERITAFEKKREQIVQALLSGNYQAQVIKGVEIPKENGKKRLLGIPTVTDRMLQQAVHQVIYPLFEIEFKTGSYGFRPNRNAHQAVLAAQKHINEGFCHIVDIDLKTFFDEVDHCILLQLLYHKIKCPLTMRLIRKWLRAPISIEGKLTKRRKGVPQGSPLSPLLSNIMLNELDKELEKRGHRYVRYADDFSIYTQSHQTAREIGNIIYLFLKNKLKLPINREKSGIRTPDNFEILGFRFIAPADKAISEGYEVGVSDKSWKRLKLNVKTITRKTSPKSFDDRISKLTEVERGWVNYFRMASMYDNLYKLDGWVRTRLRYCIWHDWKKPQRRRISLIRLGVNPSRAQAWSRSRKGGWAISRSPILKTTITLKRLAIRGYISMLDLYLTTSPQFNEPLYTRPVRTVV